MSSFELVEIQTKDKLIHQGLFFEPQNKSTHAYLWVHGLTSNFYSHIPIINAFIKTCTLSGSGFAAFNNRGHDMIAGLRRIDVNNPKGYTHVMGGAGNEIFEQSVYDIDAALTFLGSKGFSKITIIGHSTGANKVCFYTGTKKDLRIKNVVLVSPLSDRLDVSKDKQMINWQLSMMEVYLADGKADELFLNYFFFPLTPRRFLSLFRPNSTEDTFDYGDSNPKLTCFASIEIPIRVILAENDEHADRPVHEILKVFREKTQNEKFSSVIIPKALHSFNGTETQLVDAICSLNNL